MRCFHKETYFKTSLSVKFTFFGNTIPMSSFFADFRSLQNADLIMLMEELNNAYRWLLATQSPHSSGVASNTKDKKECPTHESISQRVEQLTRLTILLRLSPDKCYTSTAGRFPAGDSQIIGNPDGDEISRAVGEIT